MLLFIASNKIKGPKARNPFESGPGVDIFYRLLWAIVGVAVVVVAIVVVVAVGVAVVVVAIVVVVVVVVAVVVVAIVVVVLEKKEK